MKCELCHQKEAETVLMRKDGEEELYVCKACAHRERVEKHRKSQRTRKVQGLPPGVSMSVTEISGELGDGETPPPFIGAIMDAFQNIVGEMGRKKADERKADPEKRHDFPCSRVEDAYRIGKGLHLEGLHLIGELEQVRRAAEALGMELAGICADGVRDTGHVYRLRYAGTAEPAKRFVAALITQERNARARLLTELPRVFGDSVCRALAILKNCRLLSPGEFFDLLSPLRLAALEDLLDGISYRQIMTLLGSIDLSSSEDQKNQDERDAIDAARADEMNGRFEEVVLNDRAEEKFL